MMKGIVRVISTVALLSTVEAGWFGGSEEPKKDRRAPRGRRDEKEPVEYNEVYNEPEPYQANEDYDHLDQNREKINQRKKDGLGSAIGKMKDFSKQMKKKHSKSRDEMISDEYTQEMLNDEIITETFTPELNDDGYLTDEDINRIWSDHMHDFVPEDMMNAIVEHKSTEALFEYIGHTEPTTVKGAYYVLNGNEDKTIDCMVYDPNRDIVYKRKGSAQGILLFNTTMPGEYAIIFSNHRAGQDLTVTLALHTYEEKDEEIQYDIDADGQRFVKNTDKAESEADPADIEAAMGGSENMAATEDEVGGVKRMLREIQTMVKQIQSEAKLSMMRQNGHNEDLLENQDWNFYFMLVEVLCFFCVAAFQLHHIKKLLDNKLII